MSCQLLIVSTGLEPIGMGCNLVLIKAELCFPEAFWDDCDLLENLQFCPSVSGFDWVAA